MWKIDEIYYFLFIDIINIIDNLLDKANNDNDFMSRLYR